MDIAIVAAYLVVVFGVGIWYGRDVVNLQDYSVGGKGYSAFVIFATLSASFIGGGFSIGNAEKVYLFGIANIFVLFGFSIQQCLVAKFLAPRMGKYESAISVGDIMFEKYGKVAKVFTGIFSFLVCAGILGAQIGGIGYIFNVFLDIPRLYGILIGCGIVIAYSTIGGMKSVIATDVIQFLLLIVAIPAVLIMGISKVGGISALTESLPANHLALPGGFETWTALVSLFFVFLIGETLVPPYVQRLLLSKDPKVTAKANLFSGLLSFPFFAISGSIGLVALILMPDIDPNLALPALIKEVLPIGIRGLVIGGLISIVMSSADSFLNAATVSFVNDVLKPLNLISASIKKELRIAQFLNLVLGLMAVYVAVSISSVLDILAYAYNFWSPIILVPLIAAILDLEVKPFYFIVASVSGLAGSIIWSTAFAFPEISNVVIGTLVSFICFSFVYITGKKHPQKTSA